MIRVGRIQRCPGFRYGARLRHSATGGGGTVFWVEQKGFWMDASLVGPAKTTADEALQAWGHLMKAIGHKQTRSAVT
jgi:hypothetical protein